MNPIKLKIIFMGTSAFSKTILEDLLDSGYNIISVYTRSDKKIGRRGREIKKSAIKVLAEEKELKIFDPEKFDETVVKEIKNQKPDLVITVAYGKILSKSVLEIPGFGALNVHASLLPKYRGPAPIQNAILEGETETGTTIMLMDEGIDTGDILTQEKILIGQDEKYLELSERMAKMSSALLLKTIPGWIKRKIEPKKQAGGEATYCQIIERSDGKINWTDDAFLIYNCFRAFSPWPGIFTYWEKDKNNLRLKLHKISLAEKFDEKKYVLGEVFERDGKIFVQAGAGAIALEEVQLEGKNMAKISDFICGYPNFIGSILK